MRPCTASHLQTDRLLQCQQHAAAMRPDGQLHSWLPWNGLLGCL